MKNQVTNQLLAMTILACAQGAQTTPPPAFHLKASNGRTYSLKTLASGKPVILMYFVGTCESCPGGIKDMNKLIGQLHGKVRVAGIVNLDEAQTKAFAAKYHANFPILSDAKAKVIGRLGGLASLDNSLILSNGSIAKTWRGYDQASLKNLESTLASRSGIHLGIRLSDFPAGLQNGCSFGMQM